MLVSITFSVLKIAFFKRRMAAVHIGTVENQFYAVFGRSVLEGTRKRKTPMSVTFSQAHRNNIKDKLTRGTHISVASHDALKYLQVCETLW